MLHGLENITKAFVDAAMRSKWVKFQYWVNYPFKDDFSRLTMNYFWTVRLSVPPAAGGGRLTMTDLLYRLFGSRRKFCGSCVGFFLLCCMCVTGGGGRALGCWPEGAVALVLMSCGDGRAAVHGPALLCRVLPQQQLFGRLLLQPQLPNPGAVRLRRALCQA